jgi:hypothetical protein
LEREKLTSLRRGGNKLPEAITVGAGTDILGFFFGARGLRGGAAVSGGAVGSSEMTSVCDVLVIAGSETLTSRCSSSSLSIYKIVRHKNKTESKYSGKGKKAKTLTSSQ